MPTNYKRVNLTIPDEVYELIVKVKKDLNLDNLGDATFCMWLVKVGLENTCRGILTGDF